MRVEHPQKNRVTTSAQAAVIPLMLALVLAVMPMHSSHVEAAKPDNAGNAGGNSGGANDSASSTVTDIQRFLYQTTWGPNSDLLANMTAASGKLDNSAKEAFLQAQFSVNTSTFPYPETAYAPGEFSSFRPVQRRFFYNAVHESDQLRQRVAFFLSQLWVVSETELRHRERMQPYVETLHDLAFDNYRRIMEVITLHPSMGAYLNMVGSRADNNRIPNENFSRELLQLFTIGPVMLKLDGSIKTDKRSGVDIPSYNEDDVMGLARALSGWTYPTREGANNRCRNPSVFHLGPMIPSRCSDRHDATEKRLFSGDLIIPADLAADEEVNRVLDYLFEHPNMGPFLAQRLIHHFVSSNPSEKYIKAVASAFNNNGSGVRGDMHAVLKKLFMHAEASSAPEAMMAGHLREPVLFMTASLRAFDAQLNPESTSNELRNYARAMEQDPWRAPSVFNYFHLAHGTFHGDHGGNHADGPEFAIHTLTGSLNRANFIDELTRDSLGGVSVKLGALHLLEPEALVDELSNRLLQSPLSDSDRDTVLAAISSESGKRRARMAIYLISNTRAWIQNQ